MNLLTPYKNLGWDSGIVAYTYNDDSITIQFKSGTWTLYTYTYTSAGWDHIENMKKLAIAWHGLNSYIWTHRPKHLSKK